MSLELLAPAGSPEALDAAAGEGADAVYLGLKSFNARMRSANFSYSQFEGALKALHRMGRKVYVTVNTVFEQREADRVYQLLKYLAGLGPDALIVQDFGMVTMAREFPSLRLHASTQMNIASARGANALSGYGVSRIVLARELGLEEIREIRANTNVELETFVHGALCVSASGLCLFSSYLGGKSANRGICTQACRRFYRSGDEEGYFFSPADLQLIEKVPDLAAAGVGSLKIEGRMKSAGYVGTVVRAYRQVIDALEGTEAEIRQCIARGRDILRGDFARTKTTFYFDAGAGLSWLNPRQDGGTGIGLGRVLAVKGAGPARRGLVAGEGAAPASGDTVRFHRADDSDRRSLRITAVEKGDGSAGFWIPVPEGFGAGDRVYLIQTGAASKRYAPLLSRGAEGSGRTPGRDRAPPLAFPAFPAKPVRGAGKNRGAGGTEGELPGGIYAQVSRIEDMYVLQSSRPVRCLLNYSRKTVSSLLAGGKGPLPFKPGEIILVLDPFFPQAMEGVMAEEIAGLMEKGYDQFVVNNPGHFSLFRPRRPVLIAGPYLYIFNRWAASLASSLGADYFVSPLENNRQNLEKTVPPEGRSRAFVTVFAYPALFRVRADLGGIYDFREFSDGRDESFRLYSGREGSLVIPRQPFSITDKIPFLREAGFSRFILDLSAGADGPPLKKSFYRDLSKVLEEGTPLPGLSRFNWKDGFFNSEKGAGKGPE
ncbi:MAG: U32 family peptidase [Treponema sp.]|nr:U32 family peptidase [Treponema sp.]